MFFLIAATVGFLLIIATVQDIRIREIPDWVSISIGIIGLITSSLGWLDLSLWLSFAGGAVGLTIGWLLFQYAEFGGGDAKLIAALGFVVGPVGIWILMFVMAISGGVLALIAVARGQRDYAYGPAIALGFVGYVLIVAFLRGG